jgi:hypothetical protein
MLILPGCFFIELTTYFDDATMKPITGEEMGVKEVDGCLPHNRAR